MTPWIAKSTRYRPLSGDTKRGIEGALRASLIRAAGNHRLWSQVMDAELLYFDDCPNWQVAELHLKTLASERGDLVVRRHIVDTIEEAERVGFRGSPTILLNGVDPFAGESDVVGVLSCRVYQTPSGLAGSPTIEQLRDVVNGVD